jgi:hypothetical protein
MNLYLDGAPAASGTGSINSLKSLPSFSFGRIATGDNYYSGSLDEIAIYTSALSATVVAGHYAVR